MAASRKLLVGVVLALAAAAGQARAQVGDLPAAPVPVVPAPMSPVPPAPAPPMLARPIPVPPAAPAPAVTPSPGPLGLVPALPPAAPLGPADPGPDGWGPYGPPSAPDGYFASVELQILKPVFRNHLASDSTLVVGDNLTVPSASLNWAASPELQLGYRMPDGLGYFALAYRFLVSDGTQAINVNDIATPLRSRLDLNSAQLDYGTTPLVVAPRFSIDWRVGIRVADVFYDTAFSNDALSQQIGSNFVGAGPHARLNALYEINTIPGLALFGRLDGALLIGQINQHYRQSVTEDGSAVSAEQERRRTQSVPVLNVQAGLTYTPPFMQNLHVTTGYTFENYWYLAQLGLNPDGTFPTSRGELTTQGWFLRARIDF
jgi:hypothetical protein